MRLLPNRNPDEHPDQSRTLARQHWWNRKPSQPLRDNCNKEQREIRFSLPGRGRRDRPGRLRPNKNPGGWPGQGWKERPGGLWPNKNPGGRPGQGWRDRPGRLWPNMRLKWGWQDRELEHRWSCQDKKLGRLRDGLLASRGLWSGLCGLPAWSGLLGFPDWDGLWIGLREFPD